MVSVIRNNKKWFNRDCHKLKKETRKLGREKHKESGNQFLREKYRSKLKEYKQKCQCSRHLFWKNKFELIEKSLHDPKIFWKNWKNCLEKTQPKASPNIGGEQWYRHFLSLHTEKSVDINRGESVATEPSSDSLNQPFTKPSCHKKAEKREITRL